MYADKIKTPLLMIHGMADNNSGTFPIQSERLFAALKGFGATVRFVYLPYESHGYSARESVLDGAGRDVRVVRQVREEPQVTARRRIVFPSPRSVWGGGIFFGHKPAPSRQV